MGKDVHIVVDGVSSQQPFDREIALQRMSNAGAFLTTAQSIAFMLTQSKIFNVSYLYEYLRFAASRSREVNTLKTLNCMFPVFLLF